MGGVRVTYTVERYIEPPGALVQICADRSRVSTRQSRDDIPTRCTLHFEADIMNLHVPFLLGRRAPKVCSRAVLQDGTYSRAKGTLETAISLRRRPCLHLSFKPTQDSLDQSYIGASTPPLLSDELRKAEKDSEAREAVRPAPPLSSLR